VFDNKRNTRANEQRVPQWRPARWKLAVVRSRPPKGSPEEYKAAAKVAGALGAVGGGTVTLAGLIAAVATTKTWVGVVVVFVGLLVVLVGWIRWSFLRSALRELLRRQEQAARHGLRMFPAPMRDLSPEDVSADRLEKQVPYVRRTAHSELEQRLQEAKAAALAGDGVRMVVILGPSKAGKTRLLAEVARAIFPDWTVVRPNPEALANCLKPEGLPSDVPLDQVVLWLDDLELYGSLGPQGLNAATLPAYLQEFGGKSKSRVVVLATRGGKGAEAVQPLEESGRVSSALNELATESYPVELSEALDEGELTTATRTLNIGGTSAREQIVRYGLGAHLVGGPALVGMLRTGRTGSAGVTNRAGQHVAWLVAWWAHLGIVDPLPKRTLAELWKQFPPPEGATTESTLQAALDWARTPLIPSRPAIALAIQPTEDSVAIYDYVVGNLPVPPASLDTEALAQTILGMANGVQLLAIGMAAYQREDIEVAEKALIRALQQEDPLLVPPAAFGLGLLLKHKGHLDGAKKMLQQVVDSGHYDAAPRASNSIAQILRDEGDIQGALAIFEELRKGDHPLLAAWGAFEAGFEHQRLGNRAETEDAYRQAVASQHPDAAPRSAVNLGILLYQHGDYARAVPLLQQAIDSGHHEQAPKAYRNMAVLRRSEGDLEGAEEALRAAIALGHPEITPSSLTLLGPLLAERGDTDGGITALREALGYEKFEHRPEAWLHLARLLEREGATPDADAAYQEAIDSADPIYMPSAYFHRGVMLAASGDHAGAIVAYNKALEHPQDENSAAAGYNLAGLLEEDGDVTGSEALYEQVIATKHPEVAGGAAVRLGILREVQEDLPGARSAYEQGAALEDSEYSPSASFRLGELLADTDPDAALPAFEVAAASEREDLLHVSRLAIAVVQAKRGNLDASREALRLVVEQGPQELIEQAQKLERVLDEV
jgi:tetratricopeptide (TPR) repeat protein